MIGGAGNFGGREGDVTLLMVNRQPRLCGILSSLVYLEFQVIPLANLVLPSSPSDIRCLNVQVQGDGLSVMTPEPHPSCFTFFILFFL